MAHRARTCKSPHPTREKVRCWNPEHDADEDHWAVVPDPGNLAKVSKVVWPVRNEENI